MTTRPRQELQKRWYILIKREKNTIFHLLANLHLKAADYPLFLWNQNPYDRLNPLFIYKV